MRPDPRLDRILALQSIFGHISSTLGVMEHDDAAFCSCGDTDGTSASRPSSSFASGGGGG